MAEDDKKRAEMRELIHEEMKATERPTGITIISVLGILGSLLALILGIFSMGAGSIMNDIQIFGGAGNSTFPMPLVGGFGSLFAILGIIWIIIGIAGLAAFYLLLKMKKPGFIMIIALGAISIAMSIISFTTSNIINIAIWAIIIAYLMTKRKIFF